MFCSLSLTDSIPSIKTNTTQISPTATTEQRMIAGSVFGTLNEAWDKFRVENNL
jgi:hypothetical protein